MTQARMLGQRALNRTLLERQHLLRRTTMLATGMIEHLVGMQAQAPLASYVGLWDRLNDFDAAELAGLMTERAVARVHLMRGTIHLVTAADAFLLRPIVRPVMAGGLTGHFGRQLSSVDVDAVVATGRQWLVESPRTRSELRKMLAERWPEWDDDAMSFAVGYLSPTVQVTPRGVWGSNGPAAYGDLESWLGGTLHPDPPVGEVVLRYLRAHGPASVMDVQAWSGLTKLRGVVSQLSLRTYVDADGNELYDVPDGELVDPDTPAPVRFLPEYDNVLLSHADRSRIIPDNRRVPLPPGNGATAGTVLVDGMYQGTWRRTDGTIEVTPFRKFTGAEESDLTEEGRRLLTFIAPDSPDPDVRLTDPA